jgi:predicted RNA-binding protein with PIN domain
LARLPKDVTERLARALGAFIRDVPPIELPRELKRWRSFRPQAVASRGDELLPALDDSKVRNRILEWLDDKPPLKKNEAKLLRLAALREDGWEEELKTYATEKPKKPPTVTRDRQLLDRVERERERAMDARDELRKAREGAKKELQKEKKIAADASRLAAALERKLEATKASLEKTKADLGKATDAAARERRRAKSDIERARGERDAVKTQLREVRQENRDLQKKLRNLEVELGRQRAKTKTPKTQAAKPIKRKALKAPAGLLDESPEALQRWLEKGAPLLVDGYNVTKAEGGFGALALPAQRRRLLDELGRIVLKYSVEVIVVFDGSEVAPGTTRPRRRRVKVEYSKPPETADDHLVALLGQLPADPVIVATNDRELQGRVAAKGATVARSDQLLALLR